MAKLRKVIRVIIRENGEFKDTGIGLSSVSAVVEKYDGRMEVDHTNGEFNVFIMMANISSNLT